MKVLLTYDFISTNASLGIELCRNLIFIKKILTSLSIDVKLDNGEFKQKLFFKSINQKFDTSKRFEVLNKDVLSESSQRILEKYLYNYDLIIAYELSEETRTIFDKYGIKYIDLWLSPIRFFSDMMFNFCSNVNEIQNKLKNYKVNENLFYETSKKISNQFKYFYEDSLKLEENSLLLVGQVFLDRSVIKDGIFLNLLNFKKRIKELSSTYAKIYFQKHPYMTDEEFLIYKNGFKEIENIEYLDNINTYALLSKEEITKVVSISSSVLYEAKFFNKEIEYLYKSVLNEKSIMIYKEYFKTSFWIDIFNLNKTFDVELLSYDNYFRYKLGGFWAYEYFMDDKSSFMEKVNEKVNQEVRIKVENIYYNMFIRFIDFLSELPKNKKYVLYGYGSIGKLILPHLNKNIIAIIDKSISEHKIDGINVIKEESLTKNSNVIISPFKYNDEIKNSLLKYKCSLFYFEI